MKQSRVCQTRWPKLRTGAGIDRHYFELYAGCERSVRKFVATLRPVAPPDLLVRFETEPGVQLQVD